jgi:hypothetical protein
MDTVPNAPIAALIFLVAVGATALVLLLLTKR